MKIDKRKRENWDKERHKAYHRNIKVGSYRILFRDTFIRFIYQGKNYRIDSCQKRVF